MSAFRPDGWTTPELAQAVERGQLELYVREKPENGDSIVE